MEPYSIISVFSSFLDTCFLLMFNISLPLSEVLGCMFDCLEIGEVPSVVTVAV